MPIFNLLKIVAIVAITSIFLSSCATIIGGSNYYAHVTVINHPNATIRYKGKIMGSGSAVFKAPRKEAHSFSVKIKEEYCEEQIITYSQRSFRGWALLGSIVFWTGLINGIPLPWGVAVDAASGALWKPSIYEKGVSKSDYKHFNYSIDYNGCTKNREINTLDNNSYYEPQKQQQIIQQPIKSKTERLLELHDLKEKGILTGAEFENEKQKILNEP